jgi:peptidoglycan/xylan/chitin deacetylase (PgdA/CDA1 family)
MYLVNTPWWLRAIYPQLIWQMPNQEKIIYLTFDDGPHATATPFVLDTLAAYNAKASFFCIGKNVIEHPEIYARILNEGHTVGNHTQYHANGWKVSDSKYFNEINEAATLIQSNLFRPPYGRIKRSQIKQLTQKKHIQLSGVESSDELSFNVQSNDLQSTQSPYKIIMWSVLSGDFDTNLSAADCTNNVIKHTKAGSIVVFHDSAKAWDRMSDALPKVLKHFSEQGFRFEAL